MALSNALFGALLCVTAAPAATIDGQVFDRTGKPLAGVPVQLVERSSGSMFARAGSVPTEDALSRTTTDNQGFFVFDTGPRQVQGQVLVRIFEAGTWDSRRYAPPVDRDVTRALRQHGHAVVACPVEDASGWAELAREIERAGGADSDRGRILRRLGMPPERVSHDDGQSEWRYPGVTYVFKGDALVDTRTGPATDTPRGEVPGTGTTGTDVPAEGRR